MAAGAAFVSPGVLLRPRAYRRRGALANSRRSTVRASARAYPNPVGIHALVFSGGWDEEDVRTAAAGAATAGFDLLEVPMMDRSIDAAMTRRVLDEYFLTPTCSLGLTFQNDISSTNEDAVRRGEATLHRALDTCIEIGSRYLGGVLYSALGKYSQARSESGVRSAALVLRGLARRAGEHGVVLGLEACNRYETNVVNTLGDACALIDMIGEDNVYVHADSYHMHIEESNVRSAIEQYGKRIGYMHVGDSHRGYLGSGNVDFGAIFTALASVGYEGPITFESFSSKVVNLSLTTALAIWREMWSDSADLAQHARAYIDRELRSARQT